MKVKVNLPSNNRLKLKFIFYLTPMRVSFVKTDYKKNPKLTGVIWAVLDEGRELCKNISSHVKGLLVYGAEMRIPAGRREESRSKDVCPETTTTRQAFVIR